MTKEAAESRYFVIIEMGNEGKDRMKNTYYTYVFEFLHTIKLIIKLYVV